MPREQAVPPGFKICPVCEGLGYVDGKPEFSCPECHGTLVVPDKASRKPKN